MMEPRKLRVEYSIVKAEKLGLLSMKPEDIARTSRIKNDIADLENPIFTKERFFVIRGKINEDRECCWEDIEDSWSYCPNCGDPLEEVEQVNEVYRDYAKAEKSEYSEKLGIKDIFVVLVIEQKKDVEGGLFK